VRIYLKTAVSDKSRDLKFSMRKRQEVPLKLVRINTLAGKISRIPGR
jgi:hypothetical protein